MSVHHTLCPVLQLWKGDGCRFSLVCLCDMSVHHTLCPVLQLWQGDGCCFSSGCLCDMSVHHTLCPVLQLWQSDGCLFSSWCLCDMSVPPQAVLCELWSCEEWVQCGGHSWGRWDVHTWWQQHRQGWGNASGSEHTFITPWMSVFCCEMF